MVYIHEDINSDTCRVVSWAFGFARHNDTTPKIRIADVSKIKAFIFKLWSVNFSDPVKTDYYTLDYYAL